MTWLPVPGCVPPSEDATSSAVRSRYVAENTPLIGHFGSFGTDITTLLEARLPAIMSHRLEPRLLLIGTGSDEYRERLLRQHPQWFGRLHATGYAVASDLGEYLRACDLFVQPYPDGLTTRRTTALACLSQARPIVSTRGQSTEHLWSETNAVALADLSDPDQFAAAVHRLLQDPVTRQSCGEESRRLYLRSFDVSHVVEMLKAA
jgi:glycosyltransferase involved in cell wall biosynthesis